NVGRSLDDLDSPILDFVARRLQATHASFTQPVQRARTSSPAKVVFGLMTPRERRPLKPKKPPPLAISRFPPRFPPPCPRRKRRGQNRAEVWVARGDGRRGPHCGGPSQRVWTGVEGRRHTRCSQPRACTRRR